MKNLFRLMPVAAVLVAAGCTSVDQMPFQSKVDYRSGSDNLSRNTLEIPPDLTAPTVNNGYIVPGKSVLAAGASAPAAANASAAAVATPVQTATPALAPEQRAQLVQAGAQRWLVIKGDPEKLWPDIRQFWLDNGFLLTTDNPQIGIMETDWQENRANLPQDIVTKLLRKIADGAISTGLLDKFRTRVERGAAPGTTEIYLSHQGMQEVYKDNGSADQRIGSSATGNQGTQTIWTPRPEDPELEAQMLAMMLNRFGMTPEQAQATVNTPVKLPDGATLTDNNQALAINDSFDRAWRRVGLALDRSGYQVFDRDRSKGIYFVHQAANDITGEKSDSVFSKLAFWKSKPSDKPAEQVEYHVQLQQAVNGVKLVVTDKNGAAVDSKTAYPILSTLQQQLK
ncbi:outer membrane protein assembly factor BamC [Silvimonas sp. JCM 19000]